MSIIISNGLPKSGSTCVTYTCTAIAERLNGKTTADLKFAIGMPDLVDFVPSPDERLIKTIEKASLAHDAMIVLKSHCGLDEFLRSSVEAGRILLVASFRDPRDTALSMLDAGTIERKAGSTRYFHQFKDIEQVIRPIKFASRKLADLNQLPGVCLIPYHLIANDFPFVVGMIADHLGAGHLRDQTLGDMTGRIVDLPEFNKGIADRFVTELSDDELRLVCDNLEEEAALYDLAFCNVMERYGRLEEAKAIIAERDDQISTRLQTT